MNDGFSLAYEIGPYIREERKEQGITMKQLGAELGGLSEQAISQYELGKRPLKYSTVMKIMKVFGMSFPAFLDKYNLYDEQIPEVFNGDVDAFIDFQKAVNADHEEEMFRQALDKILIKMIPSEKEKLIAFGKFLLEQREKAMKDTYE